MKIFFVSASVLCNFLIFSTNMAFAEPASNKLCFEGNENCTFVLLHERSDNTLANKEHNASSAIITINASRANTAFSPFSTFKIPNSVISLELGLVSDTKQNLSYDKIKYPSASWWPSVWKFEQYNLATAFQYSMVPIYRQLATHIGEKNMQDYLQGFDYGNHDISSGLDDFWLDGSIKISAVEQVLFLQKLYINQLSLTQNTHAAMKEIMLVESTDDYKIFAKTGAGNVADGSMLGWYVGFVENSAGVHYFAFNLNSATYGEMKASRVSMAMNHLKKLGII